MQQYPHKYNHENTTNKAPLDKYTYVCLFIRSNNKLSATYVYVDPVFLAAVVALHSLVLRVKRRSQVQLGGENVAQMLQRVGALLQIFIGNYLQQQQQRQ